MTRLLQDETPRCPYCADRMLGQVFYDMNCEGCCYRGFRPEPPLTNEQVADQDELFGVVHTEEGK